MAGVIVWNVGESIRSIEKRIILQASELCGGSATKIAEMVGLSDRTILYKLKRYKAEAEYEKTSNVYDPAKKFSAVKTAMHPITVDPRSLPKTPVVPKK